MKHSNYITFALTKRDIIDRHLTQNIPDNVLRGLDLEFGEMLIRYKTGTAVPSDVTNVKDEYGSHVITFGDQCRVIVILRERNHGKIYVLLETVDYSDDAPIGVPTITLKDIYTVAEQDYIENKKLIIEAGFFEIPTVDSEKFSITWSAWRGTYNPSSKKSIKPS